MAEQLSLFGSPEPKEAPKSAAPSAAPAQPEPAPEPVAAYASVALDIPTRALSEPFAYGIPQSLANDVQIGSTVLVHFGNRAAAGYIVDIAPELANLQGNDALDSVRIKPIEAILSKPLFTAEAARIARWMSREYVATLSECLRLFLPPGGSPRVVKGDDGVWTVERPAVKPIQNRWVMLTPEGFDYTPPKTAVRQRQLIEALQCGPVTTRDLNLLYNSMSATIKALEKRGVVVVEERRAWRGCSEQTTLSSASGKAPVALTNGQQQALAQIERARLDAHGDVVLVDVGGHGRGELAHHDDGVLGQRGEVHELLAQQVGEKAGLDVGDVGGALAEELVLHVGEHVVVHVVCLGDGLLGAHAALDGTVDHVTDALVLGELDVGAHDGGGLLADGLGHALDLGVGLLDELGDRGLVTLLLGLGVLRRVRREGQVRLHGDASDADANAVRCVDSLVH